MRTTRIVVLALAILAWPHAGRGDEANLLTNGGLTAGLAGWTIADGGGTCSVRIDPTLKCAAKNAVVLRRHKPEAKLSGGLESQPAAVKPGEIYLLECNVKGEGLPSAREVLLTVRFFSSSAPDAPYDLVKRGDCSVGTGQSCGPGPGGCLPGGSFDWQPFRLYLRAFNATDSAVVRFSVPTTGALWISDVRLTRVPVLKNVGYQIRDALPLPNCGDAPDGYLTDGIFCWNQGADNNKIGRGYRGLEQGISISLSLPRVTTVERLVLALVRPNCGHTLERIEVFCRKYGRSLKVAEGPGYLTEQFDQRLWIVEAPVRQKTEAIELRLFGRGYLIPYEIMVVEAREQQGDAMQTCAGGALAGWFVLAAAAAPAAEKPVVVENPYVRMEFCPAEGGVCKRMLYKPAGKELVYAYADAGYGLFRDRFWSPSQRDYADVAYQQEVTQTPGGTSIHLSGRGAGGIYSFTEIHKTVTLTRGSGLIRAEYEIKNTVDSMTDADYGFGVHNFLGVLGGKNRYFIPTTRGVVEVCNDPDQRPQNAESWTRHPARGWMAAVGEGRHGLAWSVDYRYLNAFYQFLGLALPTCEWQYNRINVPCGRSWKTEVTLLPFSGLDRVDGFFGGVVGSIVLPAPVAPAAKVLPAVGLVAAGQRRLTLSFRWRLLPATAWTDLGTRTVELQDGVAQTVACPRQIAIAAGTTVVGCEVLEDGRPIGWLERPVVAGAPSGIYTLARECPQIGSKELPAVAAGPILPEQKLSLEVVSPHVPWARPYARGPLKALILADCNHQREIVELMERFDLEVETEKILFDQSSGYFNEIGERSVRSPQQAQARLRKKLEQPLDVIMIAGLHWTRNFDGESRKAILEKVKAGTGLVYGAPLGTDGELRKLMPFAVGEKRNGFGWIEPAQRHFLSVGVPYDLLPRIGGIAYEGGVPAGQVLLTHAGGASKEPIPLLTIGRAGKGRWVSLAWDSCDGPLTAAGGFSRITPIAQDEIDSRTRRPGLMTDRGGRKITWRCWEYFFSLAGRGLLWAAGREPDVLAEITGRDGQGNVLAAIECQGGKRPVVLEMTYRDKFCEVIESRRQSANLAGGAGAFRFAPPAGPTSAVVLADLRVLTPEGKVVTWASGCYQTAPQVEIAALELQRQVLPPGAAPVVRGRVRLSAEPGPEHAIVVSISDIYQRLVFRQAFPAKERVVALEARPLDVLSVPMTVEVRLTAGRRTLDKRSETLLLLKPRTWDPARCCAYEWYNSPIQGWSLPYLYDLERRLAASIGVTSMMDNPLCARQDMEGNSFTSPLCIWSIEDEKFREKQAAYVKTNDRRHLVRQPCLWDPVYRGQGREAMRRAAEAALVYGGGYAYCLGDEMTLTSYNTYYDFDFAPDSIAAYRRWLEKHYGTLDALNRQWATAYRDWVEIEPMTADEARRRADGNYAPWADFRTFMDDSLADFFAYLQGCLEEVDPQAKISISGSQDAVAGNGMDWWKLCHSLKVLHSYRAENTEYLHQAFSRASGMLVAPYLNNACGRNAGPAVEASLWWGLLYECFGPTSLGLPNYFLPDLTLSETGAEAKNFLAEARGGIWPLLRSVRRDPARIAVLYSQPSIQANYILGRAERCQKVRDAWVALLHDSGLQFDFVAYAQLRTPGFLAQQQYQVLILPECLALAEQEAAQIRAFAEAGGVVIADNSAGWMDEHCRTLKTGRLDDLFKLSAERQAAPAERPGLVLRQDWGGLKAGQRVAGLSPAGKVAPAGAAAALGCDDPGGAAIWRAAAGKGQAVYLNLCMVPYREERQVGGRGETLFRQLIAGALALGHVRPEFAVEPAGKKSFHGHVVSFSDRGVRYLGVIREYAGGEPEEAYTIRLPAAVHVYDVRARKHLGKADKIGVVLYAGAAKVYCLSPVERPGPTLDCPPRAALGTPVRSTLGLSSTNGTTSVVRLDVYDPAGSLRSYYSGPLLLRPGQTRAEAAFSPALSDPTGDWTLKAVELPSGKTVERKLLVGP